MNIDATILNKILINWIQQHTKSVMHHNQVVLIPLHLVQRMQINKHNTADKQNKGHWSHDYLHRLRKSLSQNSTSLHDKSCEKLGIEGMYFNIIKAIYAKPVANIILNREKLKLFIDKGVQSLHSYKI
jgi:hypothetical protein